MPATHPRTHCPVPIAQGSLSSGWRWPYTVAVTSLSFPSRCHLPFLPRLLALLLVPVGISPALQHLRTPVELHSVSPRVKLLGVGGLEPCCRAGAPPVVRYPLVVGGAGGGVGMSSRGTTLLGIVPHCLVRVRKQGLYG